MVTLYTIGCPQCNILKTKLDLAQIEYQVISDEKIIQEKGFTYLPILEVDDQTYDFMNAIIWIGGAKK